MSGLLVAGADPFAGAGFGFEVPQGSPSAIDAAARVCRQQAELLSRLGQGSDDGHEPLAQLLAARVRSWRITVSDRQQAQALAVLDGGDHGLWLSEQADDDSEQVTLTPTTVETVNNGLLALFAPQVLAAYGGA